MLSLIKTQEQDLPSKSTSIERFTHIRDLVHYAHIFGGYNELHYGKEDPSSKDAKLCAKLYSRELDDSLILQTDVAQDCVHNFAVQIRYPIASITRVIRVDTPILEDIWAYLDVNFGIEGFYFDGLYTTAYKYAENAEAAIACTIVQLH